MKNSLQIELYAAIFLSLRSDYRQSTGSPVYVIRLSIQRDCGVVVVKRFTSVVVTVNHRDRYVPRQSSVVFEFVPCKVMLVS